MVPRPLARRYRSRRHRPRARGDPRSAMTLAVISLLRHGLLFVLAMATTAALTPVAMKLAGKRGLVDHPAPYKFHRKPTPYLGGLAVALAVLGGLSAILVRVPELRGQFAAI